MRYAASSPAVAVSCGNVENLGSRSRYPARHAQIPLDCKYGCLGPGGATAAVRVHSRAWFHRQSLVTRDAKCADHSAGFVISRVEFTDGKCWNAVVAIVIKACIPLAGDGSGRPVYRPLRVYHRAICRLAISFRFRYPRAFGDWRVCHRFPTLRMFTSLL